LAVEEQLPPANMIKYHSKHCNEQAADQKGKYRSCCSPILVFIMYKTHTVL